MMKIDKAIVASAVLWVLLGTSLVIVKKLHRNPQANPAVTTVEKQHASTHRVTLRSILKFMGEGEEDNSCSGTAVGKHAILIASHCYSNGSEITIDDAWFPTSVVAILPDGNDHAIYIVGYKFDTYVSILQGPIVENSPIHLWGNPGESRDIYRAGVFKRIELHHGLNFQVFILPVFAGDSGAGIFNENGNIIAVASLRTDSAEGYSLPLQFSEAQLEAATK